MRRVTEVNAGRKAAGIDGQVVLRPQGKAELADWVQRRSEPWKARPVKRCMSRKRAEGARSVSRRRRHSAASSKDHLGSLVVTHPFHPLIGQRLEVLFAKRRDDGMVFVCSGGTYGQITVPQAWTDRGEPAAAHRLSVEGLTALDTLLRNLQGR